MPGVVSQRTKELVQPTGPHLSEGLLCLGAETRDRVGYLFDGGLNRCIRIHLQQQKHHNSTPVLSRHSLSIHLIVSRTWNIKQTQTPKSSIYLLPPSQPIQLLGLRTTHQPPQPRFRQEIMVIELKPRHHRLGNQQPPSRPVIIRPPLLVRQQKASLIFPPLHNPLRLLALRDVQAHDKILHPLLLALLVRVDEDVSAPASVEGVDGPRAVPVEVALRGVGREEVEDCCGGAAEGWVEAWAVEGVSGGGGGRGWEGGGDLAGVAVGFYVVAAFDVGEHGQGVDYCLDWGGLFLGGFAGCLDGEGRGEGLVGRDGHDGFCLFYFLV